MGFFDMFDKIDDLIYKPIETICDWCKEPLRKWEADRKLEYDTTMEHLKQENKERDLFNEQKVKRMEAELDIDVKRWNAEINEYIFEKEDERRDRLVESIKQYKKEMAQVAMDIAVSLGHLQLDLRKDAINLVIDKTKEIRAMQVEAENEKKNTLRQLKEDWFETDYEIFKQEYAELAYSCRQFIDSTAGMLKTLDGDIKKLNENLDSIVTQAINNTNKSLDSRLDDLQITNNSNLLIDK